MRFVRIFTPLLLAVFLAGEPAPMRGEETQDFNSQAEIQQQRRQMEQLVVEKAQIREKLGYFKSMEAELATEVERLRELVASSGARKKELEEKIAGLEKDQRKSASELAANRSRLRRHRRLVNARLGRLYRVTRQSQAQILFQTVRFRTFARDARMLSLLQEHDRRLITEYEELVEKTSRDQDALTQTIEQQKKVREEMDQEDKLLAERQLYLQNSIQDMKRNRELYNKYLSDMDEMIESMETAIKRIEAAQASQQAAPKDPGELKGRLPSPARGSILARFGEQDPRYELKKFQRGLVLKVDKGADIKAVAAGRVVHAGPFRGYQQLVVVDHGGGLFSVYGHLENLQINQGASVSQGTTLGRPIFQEADDSHNLYFEIRYDGSPEDPLEWLAPDSLKD
ncbi:MAG: peptidoglycan DD-metalloendopeptidase family protein [Deltaproteobacteria bacterium]|nr:peptidoglycan DD-metalloendopeptidase family protein [Deltaproteobacteria bacterium]